MGFFFGVIMKTVSVVLGVAVVLVSGVAQAFPSYASGGFRGAELLTAEEQSMHADRLFNMKSYTECTDYMTHHNIALDARATAKGVTLPPVRGNPCTVMRTLGRVK